MHNLFKRESLNICLALLLLVFVAPVESSSLKESFVGVVTHVSDGDTLKVTTGNGTVVKIRLAGMDTPETQKVNRKTGKVNKPGQPYGEEATEFVKKAALSKTVRVDVYGVDRYQRILGFVFIGTINLNLQLVASGLAEVYQGGEYGAYKSELLAAEHHAKAARLGMWSLGANYESPKAFRKRLRVSGE